MSQAAKRTPFAYTPTLTDEAVAVSQEHGVIILREFHPPAPRPAPVLGVDPREQDLFWQGFQRLLDNPATKVLWQPRPGPIARLRRLFTGRR